MRAELVLLRSVMRLPKPCFEERGERAMATSRFAVQFAVRAPPWSAAAWRRFSSVRRTHAFEQLRRALEQSGAATSAVSYLNYLSHLRSLQGKTILIGSDKSLPFVVVPSILFLISKRKMDPHA